MHLFHASSTLRSSPTQRQPPLPLCEEIALRLRVDRHEDLVADVQILRAGAEMSANRQPRDGIEQCVERRKLRSSLMQMVLHRMKGRRVDGKLLYATQRRGSETVPDPPHYNTQFVSHLDELAAQQVQRLIGRHREPATSA